MTAPFTTYKLIVLYMLKNLESSLTNSQITDFILDREYTNYFNLQQAIHELVSADLISAEKTENTSYYQITEEGRMTLSYFENDLSNEIKKEVLVYLKEIRALLPKRKIVIHADLYKTSHEVYEVICTLAENENTLIVLTLAAPSGEAAEEIARNWKGKHQRIYELLMEELL